MESQRQRKRVRERGGKRARGRERNSERKHKSAKLISSNSQFEKKTCQLTLHPDIRSLYELTVLLSNVKVSKVKPVARL